MGAAHTLHMKTYVYCITKVLPETTYLLSAIILSL